ncbi:substrate-binding domain-containing protein [Agaribacterium sp. ZY112]|uniref:substrate-binding domain-containing protein n=1 Tax=Agaribacterium sp. ZY112 TaxID=3233574 RepID=UPI00352679E7
MFKLSRYLSPTLVYLCFITVVNASETMPIEDYESNVLIRIHGSNTVGARLVPSWAKDYLAALGMDNIQQRELDTKNEYAVEGNFKGQNYAIHIAAHGSSTGFKSLMSQQADIAMSSRQIKDKEVKALENVGDMRSFSSENVVAIDGLAVIIHPSNNVNTLSIKQIAELFSGNITNWAQLGGPNQEVSLYARDKNSGTWDTFKSLVLKKTGLKLSSEARRFESNDELSDLVAMDTGGIGFVGLASVRNAKALAVSDSGSAALTPAHLQVATEDYPLSRRLYLYFPEKPLNPRARDFIEFTQQQNSQLRVDDIGFVSLNPLISMDKEQQGPQVYRDLAELGDRLSINFRFDSGSAKLDNRAKRDIQRLVEFIQKPENKDKSIQLVGFGDMKQTQERAVLLSKLRANTIKSALHKKGVSSLAVAGFGAVKPVASQEAQGRTKNQRVEVWLLDKSNLEAAAELKKNTNHIELSDSRIAYF